MKFEKKARPLSGLFSCRPDRWVGNESISKGIWTALALFAGSHGASLASGGLLLLKRNRRPAEKGGPSAFPHFISAKFCVVSSKRKTGHTAWRALLRS